MQRLIFVFILGFAATSFGQNNVPAENTNSEPTNSGTVNNGVTNNSGYQFNTKKVTETQPRTLFSIGTPAKATAPKTASEDLNLEMDLKEEEKADSPVIQQQVQMQERFEDNQYRSNSQY